MLGNFLQELSITPEEFEIACMEGKNLSLLSRDEQQQTGDAHSFSFHNGLFQQIWAANDIRIFVRLMKQRNLEIQIQGKTFCGINFRKVICVVAMEKGKVLLGKAISEKVSVILLILSSIL